MSKRETPMTRWFWQQTGGTRIEEFPAVTRTQTRGPRWLDAIIVTSLPREALPPRTALSLQGHDVIIVQAKNSRLGMYLMGQTLFSAEIIRRFNPRSVLSIALCAKDDELLHPMLKRFEGCEVCIAPPDIVAQVAPASVPSIGETSR